MSERVVTFETALALLRMGFSMRRRSWRGTPWKHCVLVIHEPLGSFERCMRLVNTRIASTLPWDTAPDDVLATDWELVPSGAGPERDIPSTQEDA